MWHKDELDHPVKIADLRQVMAKACPPLGLKDVIQYGKLQVPD
jgi:hypothetical protein